jgi:hypothetical protein
MTTPQGMLADAFERDAEEAILNLTSKQCQMIVAALRLSASPAGNGGREQIARMIGGDIFGTPDSQVGPVTRAVRRDALAKADAILALTSAVAPDGAREALETIKCYLYSVPPDKPWIADCRAIADRALALTPSEPDVVAREVIPLADHDEIGRKVSDQPWEIQEAIVTITAHCTALTDEFRYGKVADLAGCISQCCLELAAALTQAQEPGEDKR